MATTPPDPLSMTERGGARVGNCRLSLAPSLQGGDTSSHPLTPSGVGEYDTSFLLSPFFSPGGIHDPPRFHRHSHLEWQTPP